MWSVFIADDEPKIRRRLRRVVESAGDEFSVCGEAADGIEAMERITEEFPDILLVDICMPRLNGLDFIQQIEARAGNCVIIVITGHDEFDFAKRAVQLPVFEYVLKPVEGAVLEGLLRRAAEELLDRRQRNDLLQWAELEVKENRSELAKDLLDDWIYGLATPPEIEERKRVLSLDSQDSVHLLAIQLNSRCYEVRALDIREHKVLKVAVRKLVEDALGSGSAWIPYEDRHGRLFYLFETEPPEDIADTLRDEIQGKLAIPVQIGMAACRWDYESFIDDYERICALVDGKSRDGAFLDRFYSVMERSYSDPKLNLETVASTLSLSPGYVSRRLKQQTGYSFSEFTNRFRILKAIRLLSEREKLMYEIAEEVGYASQHYFSRIFKRITGSAPADYGNGGKGNPRAS